MTFVAEEQMIVGEKREVGPWVVRVESVIFLVKIIIVYVLLETAFRQ